MIRACWASPPLFDPLEDNKPGGGIGGVTAEDEGLAFGEGGLSFPDFFAFAEVGQFDFAMSEVGDADLAFLAQRHPSRTTRRHSESLAVDDKVIGPFERQAIEFLADVGFDGCVLRVGRFLFIGAPDELNLEFQLLFLGLSARISESQEATGHGKPEEEAGRRKLGSHFYWSVPIVSGSATSSSAG